MDFNGDGVLDLILGERANHFNFYTGNGDGTVHSIGYPYDDENNVIERDRNTSGFLADMNGDNKLDFIAGGYSGIDFPDNIYTGRIEIHMNLSEEPSGMLWDADVIDLSDFHDWWKTTHEVYDLNGDGLKDLILGMDDGDILFAPNEGTSTNPQFTSSSVLQTDVGDMNTGSFFDCGYGAREHVVDYNSDGIPDMVAGSSNGYVLVFIGYYN